MRATLDSLQEFRVTTSNYDASAGRSSGAQVNLVTKSGTNLPRIAVRVSPTEFHVANDWFNKEAELKAGLTQCATPLCATPLVEHSAGRY